MAVLKRFSYDNIVEHNPTAPDPVDYDGGGEGSGVMYINSFPPSDDNPTLTPDKTFAEVQEALSNGILPIYRYVLPIPGAGNVVFATLYLSSASPDEVVFTSTYATRNASTGDITLNSIAATMNASGSTGTAVTYTFTATE